MAKETESPKIVLERTYVIPLSRELLKVPGYKKAKKAVRTVQAFIKRHMKSDDVLVGQHLNLKLWEHGIRNPPKNVKVTTTKDEKGVVRVELFGTPKEEPKKESRVKAARKVVDTEAKPVEEKAEEKKVKEEQEKVAEHEEISELRKENPRKQHHPQKELSKQRVEDVHPNAPKHL